MDTRRAWSADPSFSPAVGVRLGEFLRAGVGSVLLSLGVVAPPPLPAAEPAPIVRHPDWQLALRARQLLAGDALLAPCNLGVTVHERIATLWGPVPSATHAGRAVALLWEIPGMRAVRNELRVEAGVAELNGLPPYRPGPAALPTLPPAAPRTPAALTGAPNPDVPTAPIRLLAPVSVTATADPAPAGLEQAVAALRRRDGRFRGLQAEVRRGLVYVRGGPSRTEDAFRFAQAVADLPGVERVIVLGAEPASSGR